jgi:Tfp pilus assembly protein PilZ
MYDQKSRRKATRYSQGNLFVMVKRYGLMGVFQKPHVVNWMDFNQFGMSFVSECKYNIGSDLLIELAINDDASKESLSGIVGNIINAKKEPAGTVRYGIKFKFDANDYMKSEGVKESLGNMEHVLKNIFVRLAENRIS